MALTVRTNGTGAANLITAAWWNDYYNLLTGVMQDQPVSLKTTLSLLTITDNPNLTGCAAAIATGSGLGIGTYYYTVTFINGVGETTYANNLQVTTTSGNQKVNLTGIPTGGVGVTGRKIYRSVVNGSTNAMKLLATINDNTTTTYADTTADASLGAAVAPTTNTCGGALFLRNPFNSTYCTLDSSGLFQGQFTVTAGIVSQSGITVYGGGVGIFGSGNGGYTSYYYPAGGGSYSSGGIIAATSSNQLQVTGQSRISLALGISAPAEMCFMDSTGFGINGGGATGLNLNTGNASTPSYIKVGVGFGVKNNANTKLMEVKSTGNMVISGTQYATSAASVGTASGQSFDAFDVAEVYECDQSYPSGTVVCPGPNNKLTRCTHDACPCAMLISYSPGFAMGDADNANGVHYVALAGRVNVATQTTINPRDLVTSDGQGGVRPLATGEHAFVLGFALNASLNNQVGVFLRTFFS